MGIHVNMKVMPSKSSETQYQNLTTHRTQGLQVYHDGAKDVMLLVIVGINGPRINVASGTFELHSIGWVVSPFATVRSEILFYSSLDSYDKNKKVNDNGEYKCSYMEELAHYIQMLRWRS
ncbi:hypothetical protein Tco_0602435 [Tanacetum coccineum]